MNLNDIDAMVLDMDGVLWRGDEPLPGLVPFFAFVRRRGLPFVLATNNSRKTPGDYVGKLAGMGVNGIKESEIITSGTATAGHMREHYPAGTRVYVIGGDGLREILTAAGFVLADSDVAVVVAGVDFDLTYDKVRRACLLIRAGATFIGTNPDVTFPTPEGLVPGAGSILALLQAATDIEPTVIGKPARPMFDEALRRLGTTPQRTLMVGDRLGTDIIGGQRAGMRTALLLTGVTTPDERHTSDIQPDATYADLTALMNALNR